MIQRAATTMRAVIALATLLVACAPSYTPIPGAKAPLDGGTGFIRFPGGFAQSTGERAFIEVDGLGVDAVDLDDGDVAFRDEQADKILGAARGRLVFRDRGDDTRVSIGVLDVATGERIVPSQRVDLPGCPWLDRPTLDAGALLLRWEGKPCLGGAPPGPHVYDNVQVGGLRVDLERGAVTRAAEPEAPHPAEPPPLPAGTQLAQYWTGSDWHTDPIPINGERVVLVEQGGARLLHWLDASGAPVREHRLSAGPGIIQITGDSRYLAIPRGGGKTDLVSLADGAIAAHLRMESTSSITRYYAVVRGLFFYGRSRLGENGEDFTLVAIDATGREVWTHDVIGKHRPLPP